MRDPVTQSQGQTHCTSMEGKSSDTMG